ncbi:tetratricopeptide repeat protein [Kitasatospora viridis]|uniref:Tetratricopeptide repeat protein n=1 Tax=Kitasatospora viridis TaxID=281105 RepID=A0A561SEN2_9ACTN|nr:hypothetical protein [Kitasatospora viridis]TWF73321.1 hypothetical protein FHX73_16472 [Kitasatospora viridis]
MTTEPSALDQAWEQYRSGDVPGAVRTLRRSAEQLRSVDIAPLIAELAAGSGFDDLASAATALLGRPDGAREHYDFGYACIERGVSALAVPALREALALAPGRKVLVELAVALEDEQRHAEAADLLTQHQEITADWPDRYLLAYNAAMAGQLDRTSAVFAQLSTPDATWAPAADRIRAILTRSSQAAPGDHYDLRGWHYALTGGLLTTLSPHGYRQGMTGRWAYLHDTLDSCRHGLHRLHTVLSATGRRPATVALLPDHASQALGLAAAELFGLPAAPYRPGTPDALVVAYDLSETDPAAVRALRERAPGEVLFEHATCWTQPPAATADVSTLLVQHVVAPWEPGIGSDGGAAPVEPPSPVALAGSIRSATGEPDPGDGGTPADPDEALAAFAARAAGSWLSGPRDQVRSPGPVPSSRFA